MVDKENGAGGEEQLGRVEKIVREWETLVNNLIVSSLSRVQVDLKLILSQVEFNITLLELRRASFESSRIKSKNVHKLAHSISSPSQVSSLGSCVLHYSLLTKQRLVFKRLASQTINSSCIFKPTFTC